MTARTSAPPTPATFARRFVVEAQRIISRALSRHPEVEQRAAKLRLVSILGSDWLLLLEDDDEPRVLANGHDPELAEQTHALTRAAVSELSTKSKERLMRRMDTIEAELSGSEPPHFRCEAVLEGLSWALRVRAHSCGTAGTVAEAAGVLAGEQEKEAA